MTENSPAMTLTARCVKFYVVKVQGKADKSGCVMIHSSLLEFYKIMFLLVFLL